MSQTLDFSIPKGRLLVLLAAVAVTGLLLYSAGILTGTMLSPQWMKNGRQELFGAPLRARDGASAISRPLLPEGGGSAAKAAAKPIATKSTAEPEFGPPPPRLVVQVASFNDQFRAQRFADSLKRQRFPVLSLSTMKAGERTWYSVRLGPYADWDSASRASAEVQRSYDVETYVRTL